ncbi:hypothetical protein OSB04_021230, partial [Centaurea solstitialis]
MVGPEAPMTTRLQTRVDAHEERIETLSNQVKELTVSINSMKEILNELPKSIEKLTMGYQKPHDEDADDEEEITVTGDIGSSERDPKKGLDSFIKNNHFETSLFSMPKVKLPLFEGIDPRGWIIKAELYFQVHQTPPPQKLKLTQMCMDGSALNWFTNLLIKHPHTTWDQFRDKLMVRFGETKFHNAHEALGSLYQVGDINEYIERFEALSALIPDQTEAQSTGMFLRGLQNDIKNWVRALNPRTCDQAMDLARHVAIATAIHGDRANQKGKTSFNVGASGGTSQGYSWRYDHREKPNTSTLTHYPTNRPNTQFNQVQPKISETIKPNTLTNRFPGTRHLTKQEWEDRRKRGLCFSCGQKYSPQHKCTEGQLRVILLADGEEMDDDGEIRCGEAVLDDEPADGECNALQLYGLESDTSPTLKTLKLAGEIRGIPALILVDSGATHNFLSKHLATALGLEIQLITSLSISLGDGTRVRISELCQGCSIQLGSFTCIVDALVYDLGSLDMILGIAWLGTLGDVVFNWQTQRMRFWDHGSLIQLRGVSTTLNSPSSLQTWLEGQLRPLSVETKETSALSVDQQTKLNMILLQFTSLFQPPQGLPPVRSIEHAINLREGQGPICVRPYRYPHLHKDEIQRQVLEMLETGIIKVSQSAYSSPVILVKKKDSTWRLCIDYRALNRATIPDKYPIPVVEELLDELHGSQYFTKIDLKSGFYQVRVRESDTEKTAFRTHNGHYEFLVMPFGLTNAPATFQALMNEVFRPLLRKGVLVFFDDILIYSQTWEQHLQLLVEVLSLLQSHQLVVNQKKSSFGRQCVEYLGHIINGEGVSMDPSKISAVQDWPIPKNSKAVRGFLGLTGYYRKFIKGYGKIARPLTDLTKKDGFHWSLEAQSAFEELKRSMITAPVLALPDFSHPFEIECDASGRGLGAVLMQHRRPIAYFSKALSDQNLNKSAYEKEIMALVLAIQHWRPYLLGRDFIVFSDQKSLRHLLEQRITTTDQQNWIAKLLGYQFSICYKPGKENGAADALSRVMDGAASKIVLDLTNNPLSHPGFAVSNGKLYHKGKLVIPASSQWIPKLIAEFHDSPTGGHSGFYRTYRRLASQIYWLGMTKTVKAYVQACDTCQRYKSSTLAPGGLLQPLPIPAAVWEDISLDFITALPKSKGFDVVLVVVDRFSKYCHFIPLKHPISARSLAETFLREVIRLHGIPKSMLCDRDPLFLSKFWQEIFSLQGSHLKFSSAYHPETDGQTEVVNRSLETYLRCFAAEQPKTWSFWLPWAEFWHNTAYHVSTKTTPFEIVYGRPPPTILQFVPGEIRCEAVAHDLTDRDEAIKQLKYHLSRAQAQMKTVADKHRRDVEFSVGDWVFLKLRPHRQQSVVRRINQKLSARYYGPFLIIEKVGSVAYRLQLPASAKIHPVFHVSLLKRAIGNHTAEASLPLEWRWIPLFLLHLSNWLIQWEDGSAEEATWEDASTIQAQFPSFRLEDKPALQDGSIDSEGGIDQSTGPTLINQPNQPRPWKVYYRRRKKGQ